MPGRPPNFTVALSSEPLGKYAELANQMGVDISVPMREF